MGWGAADTTDTRVERASREASIGERERESRVGDSKGVGRVGLVGRWRGMEKEGRVGVGVG